MTNCEVQSDDHRTAREQATSASQPQVKAAVPGLVLGSHRLTGSVVLAPMSGVTDASFRAVARRLGASLVVSEMVASEDFVRGEAQAQLKAECRGPGPHVVQLVGCESRWLAQAATVAEGEGADVIDINMGCPARRVAKRQSGSALMRDLDHAAELIRSTIAAVSIPVTVKMRLGWDDSSLNAAELARRAADLGAAMITVHGRTRAMFFNGNARWGDVAPVVNAVTVPVIVNGDINGVASARAALAQSGAAGVMIGRAALGKPWLLGEVAADLAGQNPRQLSGNVMAEAAVEHVTGLLSSMGREVGLRHARKHLAAYADEAGQRGFSSAAALKPKMLASDDAHAVLAQLQDCFTELERCAA